VNVDSSEVAQEKLLSVFGAKRALKSPVKANQLTQFVEMIASVRYRDQPAPVTERPVQLTYCLIDVGNVVEHPRGDRCIERSILERKCLDVGLLRGDAFVRCESNHRQRKVTLAATIVAARVSRIVKAKSPKPQPTSRICCGSISRSELRAMSSAWGPVVG
jgi:hypothetical protein